MRSPKFILLALSSIATQSEATDGQDAPEGAQAPLLVLVVEVDVDVVELVVEPVDVACVVLSLLLQPNIAAPPTMPKETKPRITFDKRIASS
jgi:hypothetical protein